MTLSAERATELTLMLERMRFASNRFYRNAVATDCHQFLEFTGLMNEYIKVCESALARGVDFTNANGHTGEHLPLECFERAYVREKLDCIYGPQILENAQSLEEALAEELGKDPT
jgi:hypothetical protein